MARVPYLDQADLPAEQKDLLKRPIWLTRALVNSPNASRAFHVLGDYIRYGSKLDMRLRELAILQVGWLARAPYEWSHHVKLGLGFGVSEADIRALIDWNNGKPTSLDELAMLCLRGATEMTAGGMADATFARLQELLGNEQVVDLTIVIGFYCGVVRVLDTLKIDVEPEYMPYLEQFPLPA